ncbi:MAG: class I SAM-dependent methyltransferase [Desulfobacterales bacterium]|nr:class I SAM-dependent methyltransferase [Desulfobacterales bacterium]
MKNILDIIFLRSERVCPWWACYSFDNPVRKLFQDPYKILSPYIKKGFTIIDIGPGMGYFTIPLLKLAGKDGRVIAVDIQEKMLRALKRRAMRSGVDAQLITHLSKPDDFGVHEKADFIVAFWMLHEVPDKIQFLKQVKKLMKSTACALIVEPKLHVTKTAFDLTIQMAKQSGLIIRDYPTISLSRAILLTRS